MEHISEVLERVLRTIAATIAIRRQQEDSRAEDTADHPVRA